MIKKDQTYKIHLLKVMLILIYFSFNCNQHPVMKNIYYLYKEKKNQTSLISEIRELHDSLNFIL